MKEVKAIVVGAAGKMGSRIIHIINETPSISPTEPLRDQIIRLLEKILEKSSG